MKKLYSKYVVLLSSFLLLVVGLISCDSDFMDQEDEVSRYTSDTYFITSIPQVISVDINVNVKNKSWRVVYYPDMIEPYEKTGTTDDNGVLRITLGVNNHYRNTSPFEVDDLLVYIKVNDLGVVAVPLRYNLEGDSDETITLNPSYLQLTDNEDGAFELFAGDDIDVYWEIVSHPDWMNFGYNLSGWTTARQSSSISFRTMSDNLDVGVYEGNITIKCNEDIFKVLPVSLDVTIGKETDKGYDGTMIGCGFIDATNTLLVVTKNPNQIHYLSSESEEPSVIDLQGVPKGMALSEDQSTLAISFTNTDVSIYDAQTGAKNSTFDLDVVAQCLAFGSEDYLYFLNPKSSGSDYKYLNSLNLSSGAVKRSNDYEGGYDFLKKVPGKNIIVTSKRGWSPSYIILYYDTDQGNVNKMNDYNVYPSGIWPSDDGMQLFTGSSVMYKVPEYDPDFYYDTPMPVDGELDLLDGYTIVGFDSDTDKKKICAVSVETGSEDMLNIRVFDKTSLVQLNNINVSVDDVEYDDYWVYRPSEVYFSDDASKVWVVQSFPNRDEINCVWRALQIDIP